MAAKDLKVHSDGDYVIDQDDEADLKAKTERLVFVPKKTKFSNIVIKEENLVLQTNKGFSAFMNLNINNISNPEFWLDKNPKVPECLESLALMTLNKNPKVPECLESLALMTLNESIISNRKFLDKNLDKPKVPGCLKSQEKER